MNNSVKVIGEAPLYRSYVGPPQYYDRLAALQFCALTNLGLSEDHAVLDIGCGSLRLGRLLIPFLKKGKYYGIEPNKWLVEEGLKHEVSNEMANLKKPTFHFNNSFELECFGRKFDFILAISIFSHAPQHMIKKCLNKVSNVLSDSGYFIMTYCNGDTNYIGEKWVDPGNVTYTKSFIKGLISEAGLNYVSLEFTPKTNQEWLILSKETRTSVFFIKSNLAKW